MSARRRSQPAAHASRLKWIALAIFLAAAPIASAATLVRGPYLQLLGTRSVTVVWQTDTAAQCSVVVQPVGGSSAVVAGTTGATCAVALTNLSPGTRYAYAPYADGVALTAESVFQTDDPTRPFSFMVIGDSGTGGISQYEISDRMLATHADFILHTGDMIYDTGAAEDYDAKFFWPYAPLLRRLVLWPTVGNHDVELDGGTAWLDVFHTPANNPAGSEKYYSFDHGNAHFVVVDSNASLQPGTAQHTFLDQDLAASHATWKFVAFHHPVYSSGQHGSSLALRASLMPLFDAHGVDVVFMGHDHDYERTKPLRADTVVAPGAGTVYVVTGGGGQTVRPMSSNTFTAYAEVVFHFTRITVNGGSLLLQMIRDDGTVGDSMSVVKGTPAPAPLCGDGLLNQPSEQCDGEDRPACGGPCAADCTCVPLCGDGAVNQPSEACDGSADAACPGLCLANCTCGDASRFVTLTPVADTFIKNATESTWDHGASTQLGVDLDPEAMTYLRFDLSTVTAPVVQATLSLHTLNGSFDGGTVYPVADSRWVEGNHTGVDATSAGGPGLKWTDVDTNADGRVDLRDASPWVPDFLSRLNAFPSAAGQRSTVDVTAALQGGPGVYTLAITSHNTDGSTYASRETADPTKRPRLRLEIAPPTTTTTTSPTTTTLPASTTSSTTTTVPPTSTTVTATTTSSTSTTVPAVAVVEADVSVRQENPTTSFGTATILEVDANTAKRTYLRVRASGIGGRRVDRALLRLTVANAVDAESDSGGRVSSISSCGWDELTMNWNTAPAIDRPVLATVGPLAVGGVAEFDVTPAISGDGTYCFAVDTLSSNMVKYVSREAGTDGPAVVLTVSVPPPTTTTSTTTTSTTSSTSSTTRPPTTTTTSSSTTTTAPPSATVTADVSVREDNASTKYGASTILEVDADTRKITYVRVQARGIGTQNVGRALLRLTVANATDADSDNAGQISQISNCTWDELAMSWGTRPPIDGPVLATVARAVAIGDAVDFDVTPAIRGDGIYCFAVETGSGNMVKYSSREAASGGPKVVLTLSPPTTTTSSTTSSTTSTTTSSTSTTLPTTTSTSTSTSSTTTSTSSTSTTTTTSTSTTSSTTSTSTTSSTTTSTSSTTTSSSTTTTTTAPTTTSTSTSSTTTSSTTTTEPTTTSTSSSTTTTAPPTTTTTIATTTSTTTTTAPAPRVTVLSLSQGYDGGKNQLLSSQGQLDEWQTSDNRRGRVDHGSWTSLDFNNSSAIVGGDIQLVRFCVEYAVDSRLGAGSVVWQARTGALASPARLSGVDPADDTTSAPRILYTQGGDATACWDAGGTLLSALQADPSRINSLLLVIRNDDANTNLFVDWAGMVIQWVPR